MERSHVLRPELSVRARHAPRLSGALGVGGGLVVLLLFACGLVFYIINGGAQAPNGRDYTLGILIASLSFGLPGALLASRGAVPVIG